MTALLAVFGDPAGPTEPNAPTGPGVREKVLAGVLRREQARWQDTAGYPGHTVATAAVTLATLLTPASRTATLDALTGIADLADSAGERGRTADWLHRLYPDPAGWLAPLRPDLLAEQLLATTSDLAGLVAAAHDHGGTAAATAQLLGELTRAGHRPPVAHALDRLLASHLPDLLDQVLADPAGRLTPLLDQALHHTPQPAAAAQLVGRLPERSTSLAGLAATLTGQAVDHHRQRAAADPDAARPDLATSLNNLSNRLADLGRREDALAAIEEAVDVYRQLAAARPDAFTPRPRRLAEQPVGRTGRPGPPGGRAGRHRRGRRHPPAAGRSPPRRVHPRPRRLAEQPVGRAGRPGPPGGRAGRHRRGRRHPPAAGRSPPRRVHPRPRHVAEQPVAPAGRAGPPGGRAGRHRRGRRHFAGSWPQPAPTRSPPTSPCR